MATDLENKALITSKDLQSADFSFRGPFQLQLANTQILNVEEVIRILPKKRMVVFGTWEDKHVVAKLFYGKDANRHVEEDLLGVEVLRDHKIPTPALYYKGMSADRNVRILMFERIFSAKNLADVWRDRKSVEALLPVLQAVTLELATQHVLGILQHDLHFKNFLLTEKTIYTLDGAQIELFPEMLTKKMSMSNLALFFSQLGVGTEEYQIYLFRFYAKARGWLLKKNDVTDMVALIKKWNQDRSQKFAKKIFRSCSEYAPTRSWQMEGMYTREYAAPQFMQFLKNPDDVFNQKNIKILKAGRSATIIQTMLDNRPLVIKRYNMKNFWHQLRRAFRKTRAYQSWRLAQKLNLFGVTTAKPIAFIEKKWFGLYGKSYYVMEYIPGPHAGEFLQTHKQDEEKTSALITRISLLLKGLAKLEMTHGDLKITNILINDNEQPILIDLDGATEHLSKTGLRSAWRKEKDRLLANFIDNPQIQEKFKLELENII